MAALVPPPSGETDGGPQFNGFGLLASGYYDRCLEGRFCLVGGRAADKVPPAYHHTLQPVQLGFPNPRTAGSYEC